MKKMMLLGAAALVGLAFAPNAAAGGWSQFDGCQINESPPPIGDEGVFALCLLSKYEQNWGSYGYTQNYPVYAIVYSIDHDAAPGYRLYNYAEGGITEWTYFSPWANEEGSYGGLYAYNSLMRGWNTVASLDLWAQYYQYKSTGSWNYEYTGADVGFQTYAANDYYYAAVYYYQYDYGNGCTEAAYLSYQTADEWGTEEILAPQPCTVKIEQIPHLM